MRIVFVISQLLFFTVGFSQTATISISNNLGEVSYESKDHRSNVYEVISDRKNIDNNKFKGIIIAVTDYYPYGSEIGARSFSDNDYKYGFQGQEKDDEVKGKGNSINYKYRIHDARVGRFFAVDPLSGKYPHYSPYQFSGNRVLDAIELEGLEERVVTVKKTGMKTIGYSNGPYLKGPIQIPTYEIVKQEYKEKSFSFFRKFTVTIVDQNGKIIRQVQREKFAGYERHGVYYGNIDAGYINTPYDIKPIDLADEAAMYHDKGYDKINAVGENSLNSDWGTTPIDEIAVSRWEDNMKNSNCKGECKRAAYAGVTYFNLKINDKKRDIYSWMAKNNKVELYQPHVLNDGGQEAAKIYENSVNEAYKMFLEEYMVKDNDGTYSRKKGKWNYDYKKEIYVPKG